MTYSQLTNTNCFELSKLSATSITARDIAWLWVAMTSAFGYRFTNSFGARDNGVWLSALSDLNRRALEIGFKRMLQDVDLNNQSSSSYWPPNAKEFRAYCLYDYSHFGLLPTIRAFKEFEANRYLSIPTWSHPILKKTAKALSDQKLSEYRQQQFSAFSTVYQSFCDDYIEKLLASTHAEY